MFFTTLIFYIFIKTNLMIITVLVNQPLAISHEVIVTIMLLALTSGCHTYMGYFNKKSTLLTF